MGITSTISLATSAGEQLQRAVAACESSAEAVERGIAILASSDDDQGPIAASRASAAIWRDELRTIGRELSELIGELDRLVADLESVQHRLFPSASRSQDR